MSQIELVMTGYSIIIAMCLARLLDGIRPSLAVDRRYWVHAAWVFNKLINSVLFFWATWYFLDEQMNFAEFVLVLAPPSLVYFQCDALLSKNPDAVVDWRQHFFANRKQFFAANFLLGPLVLLQLHVIAELPFPSTVSALMGLLMLMSVLGFFATSHRWQAVIATVAILNLTVGLSVQLVQLDLPG